VTIYNDNVIGTYQIIDIWVILTRTATVALERIVYSSGSGLVIQNASYSLYIRKCVLARNCASMHYLHICLFVLVLPIAAKIRSVFTLETPLMGLGFNLTSDDSVKSLCANFKFKFKFNILL